MFLLATQSHIVPVLGYLIHSAGRRKEKSKDPPKHSGVQVGKQYLRSCLKGHLQGTWGHAGECFWWEKRLPRGLLQKHLLVMGVFGST